MSLSAGITSSVAEETFPYVPFPALIIRQFPAFLIHCIPDKGDEIEVQTRERRDSKANGYK